MIPFQIQEYACCHDRSSRMAASLLTAATAALLFGLLYPGIPAFSGDNDPERQATRSITLNMNAFSGSMKCPGLAAPNETRVQPAAIQPESPPVLKKEVSGKKAPCRSVSSESRKISAGTKTGMPVPVKNIKKETACSGENAAGKAAAQEQKNVSSGQAGISGGNGHGAPSPDIKEKDRQDERGLSASALAGTLASMIDREKYYPLPAVRAGLEGVITFLVKIDMNGTITGCRILESEASGILVEAAENTMKKIMDSGARLGHAGKGVEIEIPVVFRLD